MRNILCIGAGYVGGPTMAMIAKQCPEYRVHVVDVNPERIRAWQSGKPPIYEPGLEELVHESLGRNLFFSGDVAGGIAEADLIFVSVNTPTKTYGEGAGQAADLQYWEQTARQIRDGARSEKIVVEKSTLPVRTAEAMARILNTDRREPHIEVVSNPEFLAEGSAVRDLLEPDRVLIGGHDTERGRAAVQVLVDLYAHWVPRERIITTNVWSSELSKLAANAFLAQRVSSINSLSAVCEATGADIGEVAAAVGMDSRIGPKFLRASVGFGGSCFRKDILNLAYLAEAEGLTEVAEYWRMVVRLNEYQERRFVRNMVRTMFNTLSGKRIAVFGFAFKADTSDTRESPAILVCRQLLEERAELAITDPKALENARLELGDAADRIEFTSDPYEAAAGAHAIAVLTDWDVYRTLDYRRILDRMARPAFLFDGRTFLDHRALFELGFNIYPVGRAPLTRL
jgi:UDPglucose 6-dehydrogenase